MKRILGIRSDSEDPFLYSSHLDCERKIYKYYQISNFYKYISNF